MIERVYLDELAEDRRYAFICLSLKIKGATASPIRPVALGVD
jgi:kynurenine formamidase